MDQQLSKNAHYIQKALDEFNLQCRVLELPSSMRTAAAAAESIGCEVAQIAKSLIFKTKDTNQPVLVLASGANQVSEHLISNQLGEEIVRANADFVREITGFAIGGIPPIGHKNKIDLIFIDQDLTSMEEVWAAAGTPNAVFCIKSRDLLTATSGNVMNLKKETTTLKSQ